MPGMKKMMMMKKGGKAKKKNYNGSYISGSLGGVEVGNKSYKKYYKGLI